MLKKNEAKAQELTMTWIDKWNNIDNESNDYVNNLIFGYFKKFKHYLN
jgi:hypothetical protein